MPKWLKVVLIILAVSVVICGGVVGACTIFVKNKAEEFAGGAEEAKKYGQTHSGKECVDEALNKTKGCGDLKSMSGIACITNTTIFLQGCMDTTSDKQSACENGPNKGENVADWGKRRCSEAGMTNNEGCQGVISQLQVQCGFGNTYRGDEGTQDEAPPTDEQPAPTEEEQKPE